MERPKHPGDRLQLVLWDTSTNTDPKGGHQSDIFSRLPAMAAKAGLDVNQLYEIVNGAAGASWMFTDRGKRMLVENAEVKSALNIFVKDMDIVHEEAKKLAAPIPVASSCLQQYISGQGLGLGKSDDSQVVKVYENITGATVASGKYDRQTENKQRTGTGTTKRCRK